MTSSDPQPRFQGHRVTIDVRNVLRAQLTRDLFAIAKLLFLEVMQKVWFSVHAVSLCILVRFCDWVDFWKVMFCMFFGEILSIYYSLWRSIAWYTFLFQFLPII